MVSRKGEARFNLVLLDHRVGGRGAITARLVVNQPYAQDQHETAYRHVSGGKMRYLADPLMNGYTKFMRRIARDVVELGPVPAMTDIAEDLSSAVYKHAPLEFGDLKASGHPTVEEGGKKVYDRPANQKRLVQDEMRAKWQLRELGLGNQQHGWSNGGGANSI